LYKIQTIDLQLQSAEAKNRSYQADIDRIQADVQHDAAGRDAARRQLELHEKAHREHERGLHSLEDQKKKIEDKRMAIKTNKEYQASLQEVEAIQKAISLKEEDILVALDAVEQARRDLQKAEDNLQAAETHCAEKKQHLEERLQDFMAGLAQMRQEREELIKRLKPDIFNDYVRIQKARHGLAVALTEKEMCRGCSMHIPPQIFNEAVLGEKLITCPHCRRILYVEREQPAAGEAAS
jgi:predicted  nucleic acid-binding Zn-ribbon protein